jgi:hypothetical protein
MAEDGRLVCYGNEPRRSYICCHSIYIRRLLLSIQSFARSRIPIQQEDGPCKYAPCCSLPSSIQLERIDLWLSLHQHECQSVPASFSAGHESVSFLLTRAVSVGSIALIFSVSKCIYSLTYSRFLLAISCTRSNVVSGLRNDH